MNWSMYNESKVRRDEILLNFSTLKGGEREVKHMNSGRRGRQFTYPDSLIRLLDPIRLQLPYRQHERVR